MRTYRITLWGAVAICFLFGCGAASAEDWKVYYNSGKEIHYYDKASIERPGPKRVKVWQKVVMLGLDKEEIVRYRCHIDIDCRERTFRMLTVIEYDPVTGKELAESTPDAPPRTDLVSSRMSALSDNVCP